MFSPNKWVRTVSIFPGFLIISFLLFEGYSIYDYFIPSLKFTTFAWTLFNYVHFFVFLWFYIACWWSFLACVFTHPGPVTDSYLQDYADQFGESDLRYCAVCHCAKPPRCHHCSICKMCVVNMDHHCPWFCNCIGYQNKKFFFLCLFYAWIGCLDIVLSLLYKYIFASSRSYFSFKYYSPLSFLCGVLAFALFLTLTFFGGFHFLLIVWDQTTIEANSFFRNTFFHVDNEKRGKISYFENWCLVMDRKWYLWFVPVHAKEFKFEWNFLYERDSVLSSSESEPNSELKQLIRKSKRIEV